MLALKEEKAHRNRKPFRGSARGVRRSAVGDAVDAVGDFVVDIAGGEDGSRVGNWSGFVEASLETALALAELLSYLGIHSKSLSAGGGDESLLHLRGRAKITYWIGVDMEALYFAYCVDARCKAY